MILNKKPSKIYTWFDNNGGLGKWIYIAAICSVVVIYGMIQSRYQNNELRQYGVVVYARMIGNHTSRSRMNGNCDDFVYQLYNITYQAQIDDYEQHFHIGDTVILRLSSRDHSVYDLIGRRVNGKDYKRAGE
ncbi:hypothetical protein BEL04_00575 [Mucilaginibacter sp. PPCGB 2223]|uniref:hypothetical protein n=1 Tax=Mucilaginibacter sp. PPCGB 2223 TaxID=1886027 RepID=UPI000826D89B|nr:hypothetical protein [Mucilaginibacter sp. PPCGB 2223]OCX52859.1 hypothetical protein BEL04_00575 [Mucilaginibacter sp. PPCGB 2223]